MAKRKAGGYRKESPLQKKRRMAAARAAKSSYAARTQLQSQRHSRAAMSSLKDDEMKIGTRAEGVHLKSVPSVFVINLEHRSDRMLNFCENAGIAGYDVCAQVFCVSAASPKHKSLRPGGQFAARAKLLVNATPNKRNMHRACCLSHIFALTMAANARAFPALICKDDLVLTEEGASKCVPLPMSAAMVSVAHHDVVSRNSSVKFQQTGSEAIVPVREVGFKSSSAGYLVPTKHKCVVLRDKLAKELEDGLRAPVDAILFHPRLFQESNFHVYLTEEPVFVQDVESPSDIGTK